MVNHIKTVLANRTSEDAKASGLSFFVDPGFEPVDFPAKLDGIRQEVLACCDTEEASLTAVMSVLTMPDMHSFLAEYDTRVEPVPASGSAAVSMPTGSLCDFSGFNTKDTENYLFSRTRDEKTDKILDRLYDCRLNDVDGYKGLAAMLFALVARLCLYVDNRYSYDG